VGGWLRIKLSLFRLQAAAIGAALLLTAGIANADFHFQNKADEIGPAESALASEITAFLTDYAVAYNNQDYRAVKAMWAMDSNPIYMAEEVPFPLYGAERLGSYFNPAPGKRILDGIDNRYSDVRAKLVAPGIAVATYRLDYDIKIVGRPASHGWDRVMAVFVREPSGWKLTAYAEAPMGPATMVRKMMQATPAANDAQKKDYATTRSTITSLSEAAVSPGFDKFLYTRKDLQPIH
jgi:ketosteroid isomerase-like protein